METGVLWGFYTILLLAIFVGIWFWAWSGKRKKGFSEAARIPLEEDDERPSEESDGEPGPDKKEKNS
jgi:cytochrome c oxidase cbb3-type subunit 4